MLQSHVSYNCETRLHPKFQYSCSGVMMKNSRGSSVRIISDYGPEDRAIRVRSWRRQNNFSCSPFVQTGSEVHPASCAMITEGPFLGAKVLPDRDADHSPPLVPRSRMCRSCISPLPFLACMSYSERDLSFLSCCKDTHLI
jgi:hypothetical protein